MELKCVDSISPVVAAQIITYLKLTGAMQALLFNFKVPRMTDGIRSFLPGRAQSSPPD